MEELEAAIADLEARLRRQVLILEDEQTTAAAGEVIVDRIAELRHEIAEREAALSALREQMPASPADPQVVADLLALLPMRDDELRDLPEQELRDISASLDLAVSYDYRRHVAELALTLAARGRQGEGLHLWSAPAARSGPDPRTSACAAHRGDRAASQGSTRPLRRQEGQQSTLRVGGVQLPRVLKAVVGCLRGVAVVAVASLGEWRNLTWQDEEMIEARPDGPTNQAMGCAILIHPHMGRGLGVSTSVTLGIPGLDVQVGDHICAFYRGSERDEVLIPFLQAGLRRGDKCICVVDAAEPDGLLACLDQPLGGECVERRQLEFFSADATYLADDRFIPARMVQFWDENVRSALRDEGYGFVRAVGEMTWALRDAPGVEQLVAYESELNRFLPRYPQIVLCLYDIERFGGELVLDMLKTHPKILLNGMVLDNPYYIEPDEFLAGRR